jgi:hypothetical protein
LRRAQRADAAGLAVGEGLAELFFFFDLDDEVVFEVFVVRLRGLAVADSEEEEVLSIKKESFESLAAYGFASGFPVKVAPPAEGALAAGPLPVPDWPLPVPPEEPPVLPVCAFATRQARRAADKVRKAMVVSLLKLMGSFFSSDGARELRVTSCAHHGDG